MFACIFFLEDSSLGVVGEKDKNLKITTEFNTKCLVEMYWKDAGKSKLFHGVIVKIHENEEVLSKFATRADSAVLKKLKVKPSLAPEQLFALPLVEESSTGKRKPKQSEKMKESEEQEIELLLPKKKKKPEASSKEEQSIKKKEKEEKNLQKKKKKEVSSKNEKKNNQDSTELHSAVLMTAMLDQFMESSTSVSDKPVSENSQRASVSGEPNVTQATVDKPVSKNCQSASVSGGAILKKLFVCSCPTDSCENRPTQTFL